MSIVLCTIFKSFYLVIFEIITFVSIIVNNVCDNDSFNHGSHFTKAENISHVCIHNYVNIYVHNNNYSYCVDYIL